MAKGLTKLKAILALLFLLSACSEQPANTATENKTQTLVSSEELNQKSTIDAPTQDGYKVRKTTLNIIKKSLPGIHRAMGG